MCDEFGCGESVSKLPLPEVNDEQRRQFIKGLAALPLATVLAYPELAQAAGHRLDSVSVKTPSGHDAIGVLAMPAKTPAPAVLLIHEWWGLNDQIKAVAAEFAALGYIALAVDLYDGKMATDAPGAKALMSATKPDAATEKLVALVNWLKGHKGASGKVGTIGWCFGGGWSLNASLATKVDATVIYYGRVNKSAADLKSLASPVLGHFGTHDKFINKKMVDGFEKSMQEAGKPDLAVHWYDADHAFANPSGSRYDEADAKLAWERTQAFFKSHLM